VCERFASWVRMSSAGNPGKGTSSGRRAQMRWCCGVCGCSSSSRGCDGSAARLVCKSPGQQCRVEEVIRKCECRIRAVVQREGVQEGRLLLLESPLEGVEELHQEVYIGLHAQRMNAHASVNIAEQFLHLEAAYYEHPASCCVKM
jgi:hypothetical protein